MHQIERIPCTYRHKSGTVMLADIFGAKYCVLRSDESFIGYAQSLKDAAELIQEEASDDH
jgi:hypothetical protein